jgi:hypothetical protein
MTVPSSSARRLNPEQGRLLFDDRPNSGLLPSRDGQRFLALVPTEDSPAASITVVTNWLTTLTK